jgi:hypothetical protein
VGLEPDHSHGAESRLLLLRQRAMRHEMRLSPPWEWRALGVAGVETG